MYLALTYFGEKTHFRQYSATKNKNTKLFYNTNDHVNVNVNQHDTRVVHTSSSIAYFIINFMQPWPLTRFPIL